MSADDRLTEDRPTSPNAYNVKRFCSDCYEMNRCKCCASDQDLKINYPTADISSNVKLDHIYRCENTEGIRRFIDTLISVLVNSTMMDTNTLSASSNEKYLPNSDNQQTPCNAQNVLKHIIQKVFRDSLKLPSIDNVPSSSESDRAPSNTDNNNHTSYEDLIATAIINKVISNCQQKVCSSSAASLCSRTSTPSLSHNYAEKPQYIEAINGKYRNIDLDSASGSSLEEWIHSDSSIGSTKYVDPVSLTIQEKSQIDDSDYFSKKCSSTFPLDDDSNWSLQKRYYQDGSPSPIPVPMLVPNPTTDAKVLIGDRELDETSDLSDAQSDYGDSESVPRLNSLLVESRKLIGGHNNLVNLELSTSTQRTNDCDDNCNVYGRTTTPPLIRSCSSVSCGVGALGQQMDYHMDPFSIDTVDSSQSEPIMTCSHQYTSLPVNISSSELDFFATSSKKNTSQSNEELILPGSQYSRREKEKWQHPVEMQNNPYTKENIEKRIQLRGSDDSTIMHSKEGRTCNLSKECKNKPQFPSNLTNFDRNEDGELNQTNETLISLEPATSDSDLSLVNCYDVERSVVYCKTSPLNNACLSSIAMLDENHNSIQVARHKNSSVPVAVNISSQMNNNASACEHRDSTEIKQSKRTCGVIVSAKCSLPNTHNEIQLLTQRRLVANRLGQLSRSLTNISDLECESKFRVKKMDDRLMTSVSVKDLKKRFEVNHNADMIFPNKDMYSLTARSLSRPMQEKLKQYHKKDTIINNNHGKSSDTSTTLLVTEQRVQFYESLKRSATKLK